MEPITGALLIVSSQALKFLVSGGDVSRKDLGELAAALLGTMVAGREGPSEWELRMEQKLDRSLEQDFQRSYGLAVWHARDAVHEIQQGKFPRSYEDARMCFLQAAAGSALVPHKVRALYGAAVCSLFVGRRDSARQAAMEAWELGVTQLISDVFEFWASGAERGGPRGLPPGSRRADLFAEARLVETVMQDVRALCVLLGVPQAEVPELYLVQRAEPTEQARFFLRFTANGRAMHLPGGLRVSTQLRWTKSAGRPESLTADGHLAVTYPSGSFYAWSGGVRGAEIDRHFPWYQLGEKDFDMSVRPDDEQVLHRPERVPVHVVVAPTDAVGLSLSPTPLRPFQRGPRGDFKTPEITLAFNAPGVELTPDRRLRV